MTKEREDLEFTVFKVTIRVCPDDCKPPKLIKLAFYPPQYNFCPYCGKPLTTKEI